MIAINGYEVIEQLYESDNSQVYRARRQSDELSVIIKMLKDEYPSPERIARFKNEYDITHNMGIAGSITVYNIMADQHRWFMILEDFGGKSLDQLQLAGKLELSDFLSLTIEITENLSLLHQKQLIHKDINPSNIVYNSTTHQVKFIDFGISTLCSRKNATFHNPNVLEGTMAYISPEQTGRMNRVIDYRTDLYSLGCTLYELLTGQTPFQSLDMLELVHHHLAKQPRPPHELVDVPPIISRIILKLMSKNAENRYQSANGLKADLERCLREVADLENVSFELGQHDVSEWFLIPQKLYGRTGEIDTLLTAFKRVCTPGEEKQGSEIMLIAGYSGIGKSVLVKELNRLLTKKQGYFISGKFDQLRRNIPYSALVNAFAGLVQQLLTETEARLSQWKDQILTTLGPNGQVIIDVIPEIELIIGAQPPPPQLGPAESQNRFNFVFQNLLSIFCQPDHPLIIFLDDLQWIDSATLKLLELITTNRDNTALLFIGAYRDNEVDPTHPLMATLNKLREENVAINQITLKPLTFSHINRLIADSLHQNLKAVDSLTDLVMRKTNGNPFFVNQFLHILYEENLLDFTPATHEQKGHWRWDMDQIETLNITDNVVELMIGKLKKLPESAQHVLRLAACNGNRFDLDTLSIISEKSVTETYQLLMPTLQEGLILPLSEPEVTGSDIHTSQLIIRHFQFLHDRVQEAAYSLVDDEQKRTVHLQIGRLWLKSASAAKLEDKIFDIAGHFNHSVDLIDNQAERLRIAQLNLIAGQRAKMATAYPAAVCFLQIGRDCLPEKSWETEYDLTLRLFNEAAEAAYLSGDIEQMEQLAQIILQHALNLPDEVKVCEIQILAYAGHNQQRKAVKIAYDFLKRLNISLPEEPTMEDVGSALREIHILLSGKPIQFLVDLPKMTDPTMMLAMRIMVAVVPAAYHSSPPLFLLQVLKQVDLSFKFGNMPESSFSYILYGVILCGVVGDIESGYQFGLLALDLLERSGEKRLEAKIWFQFNCQIKPWKEHVRQVLHPLLESFQIGLETGDLEYTAYSIAVHSHYSYFIGKQLDLLEEETTQHRQALARLKHESTYGWNNIYLQAILNLRESPDNPCRLVGDAFDETHYLPVYKQANDRTGMHYLHINKCILHYLFHEYPLALECVEVAEQHLDGVTGVYLVAVCYFYDSLIRLAAYPGLSKQEQDDVITKVSANQEKMKQWAEQAPMNNQHKFDLVEAERHRVLGEYVESMDCYDRAINGAAKNEYLNEEALANELAARFYIDWGKNRIAQLYLTNAHYLYIQWGATAKVKDMEERYSQLITKSYQQPGAAKSITRKSTVSTQSTTGGTSSIWLDFASIMKASHAIASEIDLDKLLAKLIEIIIENTGAQRGCLILSREGRLLIEAEGAIDQPEVRVLQSIPIEAPEKSDPPLLTEIVQFVARTHENVVLNNASQEGAFTSTRYVVQNQPKSVLCTPLMNQGELLGLIYLENNLIADAFTPERVELVHLLGTQASISITNARAITERAEQEHLRMENQFLEKQTHELEKLNADKDKFFSIVSHDLRNPFTTLMGSSQWLLSRLSRLSRKEVEIKTRDIYTLSKTAYDLLENLLYWSRMQRGRIKYHPIQVNLRELVQRTVILFNETSLNKQIQILNSIPPSVLIY
ncbi:AAA family ATPase [Desulfococcaceae bacterium HSG9]|nr:AAA family ATPase [Desulfococcaceae bacterium HSG9]